MYNHRSRGSLEPIKYALPLGNLWFGGRFADEERFPCLEEAGEAALEVAQEETPTPEGGQEEGQAAVILQNPRESEPQIHFQRIANLTSKLKRHTSIIAYSRPAGSRTRTRWSTRSTLRGTRRLVVPPGFEPGSRDPESRMMDRYTKGLAAHGDGLDISRNPSTLCGHSNGSEAGIHAVQALPAGAHVLLRQGHQRRVGEAERVGGSWHVGVVV